MPYSLFLRETCTKMLTLCFKEFQVTIQVPKKFQNLHFFGSVTKGHCSGHNGWVRVGWVPEGHWECSRGVVWAPCLRRATGGAGMSRILLRLSKRAHNPVTAEGHRGTGRAETYLRSATYLLTPPPLNLYYHCIHSF